MYHGAGEPQGCLGVLLGNPRGGWLGRLPAAQNHIPRLALPPVALQTSEVVPARAISFARVWAWKGLCVSRVFFKALSRSFWVLIWGE